MHTSCYIVSHRLANAFVQEHLAIEIKYIALDLLYKLLITVDGERFAGLNICGFCAIKVFAKMFLHCLGHKYSLCSIIKERHLYLWKSYCDTAENREKHKV